MLDFGSRMAKKDDHGADDLFSSVAVENKQNGDTRPVIEEESAAPALPAQTAQSESAENETSSPVRFSFLRKSRHHDDEEEFDKLDTCKILKNARLQQGMSYEQVEAETQIRSKFLEALEMGNFDDLPQQVYVMAYLRKLCALYKISAQDEELLVKPWRKCDRELPANMSKVVIPDEDSENSKVLRRVEFAILAGGAILVVAIVIFLVILAVSLFKPKQPEKVEKFDNISLLELQEKPQLKVVPAAPVQSKW